jgi:hypothetical protein
MPVRSTTASDVIDRYAKRSELASARLQSWRADPTKAAVVPRVESHVVSAMYDVTPDDVISVCERTEHALGEVRKADAMRVEEIRDWHPAFAFTHVFHFAVEETKRLPTYSEFRDYCRDDAFANTALWAPAQEAIDRAATSCGRQIARDAMRWRIGNAYYSFIREAFVLAVLRDSGLDAELHPLADALFRVDLWIANVNVSLFIGNNTFRSETLGRKDRPEHLLSDASPPFGFHSIQLTTQHRFGVVHLPARVEIERRAVELARLTP